MRIKDHAENVQLLSVPTHIISTSKKKICPGGIQLLVRVTWICFQTTTHRRSMAHICNPLYPPPQKKSPPHTQTQPKQLENLMPTRCSTDCAEVQGWKPTLSSNEDTAGKGDGEGWSQRCEPLMPHVMQPLWMFSAAEGWRKWTLLYASKHMLVPQRLALFR